MSEERDILNLQEAADYLGVSSKTFQRVLRDVDVPGRKVGREWKFSRRALSEWIGSGRSQDFRDADEDGGGADPLRSQNDGTRARNGTAHELSAEED